MKKIHFIKVAIDKLDYIDRQDWVKYITLAEFEAKLQEKANPEIFETAPSERFVKFFQNKLGNYLAGEQIDKEIHSAIMNCADMYASGEPITLHAGDYIALQTHFRKQTSKR